MMITAFGFVLIAIALILAIAGHALIVSAAIDKLREDLTKPKEYKIHRGNP